AEVPPPPTHVPPPPPTEVPPPPPPTQVPPTEAPAPTEVVWVNTDSLAIVDAGVTTPLAPGQSRQIVVRYQVTSPRRATTLYAELRGETTGWTISSPVLADQDG